MPFVLAWGGGEEPVARWFSTVATCSAILQTDGKAYESG
jgi:hypothetical protein